MSQTQPDGYLAVPSFNDGRCVLVLHAWWGLNETIKAFCNRLSQAGFVAFAPDLYHGKRATTIPEAEALSDALDANSARDDIHASTNFLRRLTRQTQSGICVIGFSLGAYFALELSVTDPDLVDSVVVFYGTRPGDYSGAKASYLGHFAEHDEFEPQSEVDALEATLRQAGRPAEFYQYPGTGHWFFEPDREQAFHPAAASQAWDRTLAFLKNTSPF